MSIPCNVGRADRVIRGLLGVVLIGAAVLGAVAGTAGIAAGVIGVVLLTTSVVRFCPLYRVVGLSTCGGTAGTR
jgi:hypothetical protein